MSLIISGPITVFVTRKIRNTVASNVTGLYSYLWIAYKSPPFASDGFPFSFDVCMIQTRPFSKSQKSVF